MVLFDADFLSILFHPDARVPNDPKTNSPVTHGKERISYLVKSLTETKEKIIIPTPALSEFLVLAGDKASEYVTAISKAAVFRVVAFDEKAAIEVAVGISKAKSSGDKKSGSKSDWTKIKFDRQIVAIGQVEGVQRIYSADSDVRNLGELVGIEVLHIADLPLPPPKTPALPLQDRQGNPIDLPDD